MKSNKDMEINRSNIFDLVNKCQIKPDKDYGQNFLLEPSISSKIVDTLLLDNKDSVLEIGPGLGSLTHFLINQCDLTVCDIDKRMIDFLKIFYQENITFVLNDVRKIDVSTYDKIIGNLPYNITTELVVFLLLNAYNVKRMTLMCQLEAFDRFNDLSGEKYGPVSVLLHLLGSINKLLVVKPGSFYPVPKCNSVVFSFITSNEYNRDNVLNTYKFAISIFKNRRKTIYNNLKSYLNNYSDVHLMLNELGINPMLRPENIKPETYLMMYLWIKKRYSEENINKHENKEL